MSTKIKGFLKDVGGASRVTKIRQETFDNASSENKYFDNINKVARELHPAPFKVKVEKVEDVSPTARKFTFVPVDGKLPLFQSGQYISLHLAIEGTKTTRPYSISSAPFQTQLDKPFVEITVRNGRPGVGYASSWIYANLKKGDELEVGMPYGHFYLEELRDAKDIVALAGGSGITPFYSMAQEIANGTLDFNLTILYGSVSHDDIILEKQLQALCKKTDRVRFINVISGEGAELKKGDEKGFINRDIIKKYSVDKDPSNAKTSFFVCGPLPMYNFVKGELDALKVPARRIRMEVFGAPRDITKAEGYPVEKAKEVYKLTVVRGIQEDVIEARADEPLAVALERHGIVIKTCCRSGECGACRAKVLEGQYFVPSVGDGRRAGDKRFDYVHTCSTYPLSDIKLKINIK
jgi:ferredoxin-NADP reductase